MKRQTRTPKVTFDTVRELALTFPGAVESTSYGTPAFKVKKKLFARLHQDGVSLVIQVEEQQRARLMQTDPDIYYNTDHYLNTPWMLIRLATVKRKELQLLLAESWRLAAPSSLMDDGE